MAWKVETNLPELIKKIESDMKGMLKSQEVGSASKTAGKAIGRHISEKVNGGSESGYNYKQSGGLHDLVQREGNDPNIKQGQNSVQIQVFNITNMNLDNDAKRNHQFQVHEVWDSKKHEMIKQTISLKQENQMPKWILAEFGSGKYSNGDWSQFDIGYTHREGKPYMYGPSIGPAGGPGGGSKSGFFMVSNETLAKLMGPDRIKAMNTHREHQGIRAGHVFSKGLEESKQDVFEILGDGIQEYLNKVGGGE